MQLMKCDVDAYSLAIHLVSPVGLLLYFTVLMTLRQLAYKNVLYFDTELVSSYTLNMCLDTTSLMFCILVLYLEVLSFNMFC